MPPTPSVPFQGFTPPEIARRLNAPLWAVRRTIDALGIAVRVGLTRLVGADRLPELEAELRRRGYLSAEEAPTHV